MSEPSKNIFILGAAKCGTTYLRDLLAHNSDIIMSVPKEPLFFEAEYGRGIGYYYDHYYSGPVRDRAVGEARHRNMLLPYVPRRIWRETQDPYFIVVVRDPVDRIVSHWWHWFSKGIERRSLEEVVACGLDGTEFHDLDEKELAKAYPSELVMEGPARGYSIFEAYVASSLYGEQVRRYVEIFGKRKMCIVFFSDLLAAPEEQVSRVLEFVGENRQGPFVAGRAEKNSASHPLINIVANYAKSVGIYRVTTRGQRALVRQHLKRLVPNPYARKKLMPQDEDAVRRYLRDDIALLEEYTGSDLSSWKVSRRL